LSLYIDFFNLKKAPFGGSHCFKSAMGISSNPTFVQHPEQQNNPFLNQRGLPSKLIARMIRWPLIKYALSSRPRNTHFGLIPIPLIRWSI